MKLNDYQAMTGISMKSMPTSEVDGQTLDLLHCALGVTGEAGEFADAVKKHVIYGQAPDVENMVEELGDLLWYVSEAASTLGYTLQEVADKNVAKLIARYPNGYSDEMAKLRLDKQ